MKESSESEPSGLASAFDLPKEFKIRSAKKNKEVDENSVNVSESATVASSSNSAKSTTLTPDYCNIHDIDQSFFQQISLLTSSEIDSYFSTYNSPCCAKVRSIMSTQNNSENYEQIKLGLIGGNSNPEIESAVKTRGMTTLAVKIALGNVTQEKFDALITAFENMPETTNTQVIKKQAALMKIFYMIYDNAMASEKIANIKSKVKMVENTIDPKYIKNDIPDPVSPRLSGNGNSFQNLIRPLKKDYNTVSQLINVLSFEATQPQQQSPGYAATHQQYSPGSTSANIATMYNKCQLNSSVASIEETERPGKMAKLSRRKGNPDRAPASAR